MAIRVSQHPRKATVLVEASRSRFQVTFDETGQAVEIKRERWAQYTTGKRYWARCWAAGCEIGALNSIVIARARELARPSSCAASIEDQERLSGIRTH